MATMTSDYYYCHRCNQEVNLNQDGKCDRCQDEFIEKIESDHSVESEDENNFIHFIQHLPGRFSNDASESTIIPNRDNDGRATIDSLLQTLFGGVFVDLPSNPSDYVFSDESFDNIVTRIMNQFEQSGPPPAKEEDINKLPLIKKEDADDGCTICLSDYVTDDLINKLPCQHNYHVECIKPWLSKHGTCPVCRKDLSGKDTRRDAHETIAQPETEINNGRS